MDFKTLCETHGLGPYQSHEPVSGGLLNKMYKVMADQTYAVKVINPEVVKRPGGLDHHEASEAYAEKMIQGGISGVSALRLEGAYVQSQGQEYYLVYPWLDGDLRLDVTPKMAEQVGQILKRLHKASVKKQGTLAYKCLDWHTYQGDLPWQLKPWDLSLLTALETKLMTQPVVEVMTHRDLDPKNLMWQGEVPYVIDWEASGLMNPALECLVGALDFSKKAMGYDQTNFKAYIRGYDPEDLESLLVMLPYTHVNKLGWLYYSLNQSLKSCQAGMIEAEETMALIHETEDYMGHFKSWLEELQCDRKL